MSTRDIIGKAKYAYKREGLSYIFKEGCKLLWHLTFNSIVLQYYRIFKSNAMFKFNGSQYHYFYSLYGATWRSERAVEIPIVWNYVDTARTEGKRILEVGNVLAYRLHV